MSLFTRELLEAVVLFEAKKRRGYESVATGFLVGFKSSRKGKYHTFLVTNRHVFSGRDHVYISLDTESKKSRIKVPLIVNRENVWFSHRYSDVDLALLPISMSFLKSLGARHKWIPEEKFLYFRDYEKLGFSLGDQVFFAGFPLGLSGKLKNSPILRGGVLARLDKELKAEFKGVLVDGQNFPGNSGGPVFTKPEIAKLGDTKSINQNYLLGAMMSYLPYTSHFMDLSSGQVGAISVENSGLALYVPMDYAKTIYNNWVKAGQPIKI